MSNPITTRASIHTRKLAGLALLTVIIVVLTIICSFVRFGPFSITLALVPIIIGSAVYGASSGAYLGFIMGLTILISGLCGWDGGTIRYLISIHSFATILICIIKSTLAGWASGTAYKMVARKSILLGVIISGVVCPVVNTGIFVLLMRIFFHATLQSWAAGTHMMHYMITSLVGINFLIELVVNLLLTTVITKIIKSGIKLLRASK